MSRPCGEEPLRRLHPRVTLGRHDPTAAQEAAVGRERPDVWLNGGAAPKAADHRLAAERAAVMVAIACCQEVADERSSASAVRSGVGVEEVDRAPLSGR